MSLAQSLDKETMGVWEKYCEGVSWLSVINSSLLLIAYFALLFAVFSGVIPLWLAFLVSCVLGCYVYPVAVHEAGHGNIANGIEKWQWLEDGLGWACSFFMIVVPFQTARQMHDLHHANANDPERDPDFFREKGDGVFSKAWRTILTVPKQVWYDPFVKLRGKPEYNYMRSAAIVYAIVQCSLLSLAVISGVGMEYFITLVAPLPLVLLYIMLVLDVLPHGSIIHRSLYLTTRNYQFPGSFLLTAGHNLHLVHHLYPRVPWYRYPALMRDIAPELESNAIPLEKPFDSGSPDIFASPRAHSFGLDGSPGEFTLRVQSVTRLTKDAVKITFRNPKGGAMNFTAGQYLVVGKVIDGDHHNRCYSICEASSDGCLSIGVKRVEGGAVSSYLTQELHAGDFLAVSGPFGDFRYTPVEDRALNQLVLVAGGSGITPILSIAKTALEAGPPIGVELVYANRSVEDEMFLDDINAMVVKYGERLKVTRVYEIPSAEYGQYSGYLDTAMLSDILSEVDYRNASSRFYICGPEPMKNVVLDGLAQLSIPESLINVEEFVEELPEAEGATHQVSVKMPDGRVSTLDVAENQTILQVARSNRVHLPHACQKGLCGVCKVHVQEGEFVLAANPTPGLLDSDKLAGRTLTCQCQPRSNMAIAAG